MFISCRLGPGLACRLHGEHSLDPSYMEMRLKRKSSPWQLTKECASAARGIAGVDLGDWSNLYSKQEEDDRAGGGGLSRGFHRYARYCRSCPIAHSFWVIFYDILFI